MKDLKDGQFTFEEDNFLPRRDVVEIRRANLMALIDDYKTQAYFAERIGKPASYVSQLKKGLTPKGKPVGMGNNVARDIEQALNLPFGWMDRLHDDGTGAMPVPSEDEATNDVSEHVIIGQPTKYPLVHIKYMDVKASCGSGYLNDEYPEAFTQTFTIEFLRANGLPLDGKGLVLMHACGESMGYTIPSGTVILVNTNEAYFDSLISNKIYVFNANGEMICKRAIKNIDGTVTLKSDSSNKDAYPDYQIDKENFEHFAMFGRVRYVFMQM